MPTFLKWKTQSFNSSERFIINLFDHISPRWYPVNIIGSSVYSAFEAYGDQLYSASAVNGRVYLDSFLETADTGSVLERNTSKLYDNFGSPYSAMLLESQYIDQFNPIVVEVGYRNQIRMLSDAYFEANTIAGTRRTGHAFSGVGLHVKELNKEYLGWKLSYYSGSLAGIGEGFYLSSLYIPNVKTLVPPGFVTVHSSSVEYSLTKLGVNTKLYSKNHYFSGLDITNYGTASAGYEPQLKNTIQNIIRADQYNNLEWSSDYSYWRPGENPELFSEPFAVYQDYLYNTKPVSSIAVTGSIFSVVTNSDSYDWQYDWAVRSYNDATYGMYVRMYPASVIPNTVYFTQLNSTKEIQYLTAPTSSLGAHYIINDPDILHDVSSHANSLFREYSYGTSSVYKRSRHQNQPGIFKQTPTQNIYYSGSSGTALNFSDSFSFEFWAQGIDNSFENAFVQFKNQSSPSNIYDKLGIAGNGWAARIENQFFLFDYANGGTSGSAGVLIDNYLSEEPSRWHYFAGTFCSGSVYLYVDGYPKYSGNIPVSSFTRSGNSYSCYMLSGSCRAGIDEISISENFLPPDRAYERFQDSKIRFKEYTILASGSMPTYHQPLMIMDAKGAKEIEWHEFSVRARGHHVPIPPEPVVLSAPVAIDGTEIYATHFQANWSPSSGAAWYYLDVSENSEFSSYVPGYQNLQVFGTSSVVSGVDLSLTYYYRVRAAADLEVSSNSNIISVTELAIYIPIAGNILANGATVYWATNKDATSRVDYGLTEDALNSSVTGSVLTSYHQMVVSGLSMETEYYFRVSSAVNNEYAETAIYSFMTSREYTQEDVGHLLESSGFVTNSRTVLAFDAVNYVTADNLITTEPDADPLTPAVLNNFAALGVATASVINTPHSEYTASTN